MEIFDNCVEFDADDLECKECDFDYYLSNGHCCEVDDYWKAADTACVAITTEVENCEKIDDGNCLSCHEHFYYVENLNFCCPHFNHCDPAITVGTVDNCLEYGADENSCSVCDFNHTRVILKNGVNFCYPNKINNCEEQ